MKQIEEVKGKTKNTTRQNSSYVQSKPSKQTKSIPLTHKYITAFFFLAWHQHFNKTKKNGGVKLVLCAQSFPLSEQIGSCIFQIRVKC
jgi:hypothetical protein